MSCERLIAIVALLSCGLATPACGSSTGEATDAGSDPSLDAGVDARVDAAATDPSLLSLVPSEGTLSPTFVSDTSTYTLVLPPGTASVAFTPTAAAPATAIIRVQGDLVASGESTPAIPLPAFVTPVMVSVDDRGATRSYSVLVTRDHTYFKASNTDELDGFGGAIALSGDGSTLAVGAFGEGSAATGVGGDQADDSTPSSGAVYVFVRAGATWSQQAYVKASNAGDDDSFGASITLSDDGSTLAVGAYGESSAATGIDGDQADDSMPRAGAVYVFTRVDTTWSQQAYVKASNTGAGDEFGLAIALSDDGSTLAVGAALEASPAMGVDANPLDNRGTDAGAVYVFTRARGIWSQQVYIKASNTGVEDEFGSALALSGDGATLAVGAFQEDSDATGVDGDQTNPSATDSGAVYVFRRTASTWTQEAYLKASNTGADDAFGAALALTTDGSTLVVSAPAESSSATGVGGDQADDGAPRSGAVYVFTRLASVWMQQAYIKASNTDGGERFGTAVAFSGDGNVLAVGAAADRSGASGINPDPSDHTLDNMLTNAGAVYVLLRHDGVWAQAAYVKASSPEAWELFGIALDVSGDGSTLGVGILGDRSSTIGIGGDEANSEAQGSGAVYVY
ncbi:MAG: integrin [Deltaproteobacteria bacterium]|nr:integrin [Deltaproteobacteria bacterium]